MPGLNDRGTTNTWAGHRQIAANWVLANVLQFFLWLTNRPRRADLRDETGLSVQSSIESWKCCFAQNLLNRLWNDWRIFCDTTNPSNFWFNCVWPRSHSNLLFVWNVLSSFPVCSTYEHRTCVEKQSETWNWLVFQLCTNFFYRIFCGTREFHSFYHDQMCVQQVCRTFFFAIETLEIWDGRLLPTKNGRQEHVSLSSTGTCGFWRHLQCHHFATHQIRAGRHMKTSKKNNVWTNAWRAHLWFWSWLIADVELNFSTSSNFPPDLQDYRLPPIQRFVDPWAFSLTLAST